MNPIQARQIAATAKSASKLEKARPVLPVGSQSSDVMARCLATGVSDTVVPVIIRPNARDRYALSHPTAQEHY